jgi:hypothetical protein
LERIKCLLRSVQIAGLQCLTQLLQVSLPLLVKALQLLVDGIARYGCDRH